MIDEFAARHDLPAFRRRQFEEAFYRKFVLSIQELSVWSKELREAFEKEETWSSLSVVRESTSPESDTVKTLFKLHDDVTIETVLMKHRDGRNTVCVSCQSGCPVGCAFCATGKLGLRRNLTANEIVDQVLHFARILKKDNWEVSNVVYMGMGEPMLNLDAVMESIHILTDPKYMGMGDRRITVSSSGYVPQLKKFIDSGYKGKLAISLHASNQGVREKIMPIAKVFPFDDVIAIGDYYIEKVGRRLSYEYILIKGINDQQQQAGELAKVLQGKLVHVNLIPNNPVLGTGFEKPTPEAMQLFSDILTRKGIANTLRVTMGDAIKAACGQLDGKE
jgi:23S rRNA (adenine2503-C2)-methyltransferase